MNTKLLALTVTALTVTALVLSTNATAAMINIDFEEIDNSLGDVVSGPSLETQGFKLTNDAIVPSEAILHWAVGDVRNADSDGVTFSHNFVPSTTTLTQLNGDAFDLFSIDFSDIFNTGASQSIGIDAVTATGALFSDTVTLDGLVGLETFAFNWGSLASVSWTNVDPSQALQLDNISVSTSPVPVPAAVWLFGSGLLGLVGVARRTPSALPRIV